MKTNLTFLIIPAGLALVASCGGPETETPETPVNGDSIAVVTYEELEKASWLLGTWQDTSGGVIATETWEQLNDSTFSASASQVAGGETVHSEQISLEQHGGTVYYIPTVSNQNEGEPVQFTASLISENELVFENPGHDFPQKIAYKLITPDSIVATISGTYESQESSQSFPMKRVK